MNRGPIGTPIRRRWSGRSTPKQPPPPFRTSPVRLAANVAVAGFVLANMILAHQLLGEDRSAIAVAPARSEHGGEGSSTAFERLHAALDNLSSSKIGVPLPTTGGANQAGPGGIAEASSTTFTASRPVTTESDTSSSSNPGSNSSGSNSSDEVSVNGSNGDVNEGSGDKGDEESDEKESDDNESDEKESDDNEFDDKESDDNEFDDKESDDEESDDDSGEDSGHDSGSEILQ